MEETIQLIQEAISVYEGLKSSGQIEKLQSAFIAIKTILADPNVQALLKKVEGQVK